MKRFISAVSSLVIAATAMGGTFAMSTTAASDIQTLIEFTTTVDGKRTSEITAKAGQTIPVKVYIPQSGGVNTVSLKLAINGDATLGQGTVQYPDASDPWYNTDLGSAASEKAKAGTVAPNPYLFGNYGITMTNLKYGSPYCFDSGSYYDDGWGSAAMAGNYKAAGTVPLNADGWSIGWKHESAISSKENIDAYGAWVAAGKPDTSDQDTGELIYDRVGASTWTSDVSWAYDYTFIEFDLVLPNDLKDGTYKLDNYAENYVNSLSLFNVSKNDPTVAAPVWTNSSVKGVDGSNYKTTPLTITVGDVQEETTTQPKETTTQPRETTTEPKETTTKAAVTPGPTGVITYNMIPQNKDYTAADQSKDGTFNIVEATAGEKITMALTVTNDLGTSGMQFYFKVDDGITVGRRTTGDAYQVTVKWNSTDYAYVWSTDDGTEATAADGAVLSTFALTMPSANGTYKIQLDTSKENMVRPAGPAYEVPDHEYYFHGIQFNVGDVEDTTTAPKQTTTEPKETTTEPKETTTKAQTPDGIIIYNMIPQNKDYTAADQSKDRTFNVVEVTPGEKVTMALNVTNDLGTSGMQLYFKVDDGITVGRRTTGDAYQVTVKWNATDYAYVWSTDDGTEATAADGAVLSTFALTMPAAEGTYSIDLDDSKENMVRPAGPAYEVPDHQFNFHGIQFVVKDVEDTTTAPKETTTEPKETTTTEITTTTEKQIPEGDVFWGDTNEDKDVRIADVVMLNKFIAGKTNVSDQGQKNADCQHDGELNSQDAAAIKAYLAQLIPYEKLGTANPLEGVKTN